MKAMRAWAVVTIGTALVISTGAWAKKHDEAPADPNKKVCRHETPTGSIRPTSVCHSAAEWAAIDAQNARDARAAGERVGGHYNANGG